MDVDPRSGWRRTAGESVAVAVAGLVLGGATSFAQGLLPDPLRPLANSVSGWTLSTALTVWLLHERTAPSAVFGAASFGCLVLGYTAVSALRGFTYHPLFFGAVGVIAGPFVGVAAAWLRERQWRAALGAALLGGIAIGEGVYGLVRISATTGWFYWTLIGVVGLAVVGVTLWRRVEDLRDVALGTGLTVVVAAIFFVAYGVAA